MAILTVQRDKGWADSLRTYRILLDGEVIGQVGNGEMLRQEISAGPHVVEAKIDWCGSRLLHFEAGLEDPVVIVRSALRGWRLLLGPFYVFFKRKGYLILEMK